MYPSLTKRQKEILDFIKVSTQLNGYAPSLLDIKEHFRLSAISTVHEHIQNLKEKGYIQKEINQARSIRPLEPSIGKNSFTEVPILGKINKKEELEKTLQDKSINIDKSLVKETGKYFAIAVEGNSMDAQGILDNDILIALEDEAAPKQGDIILAGTGKDKYVLGKISKENNYPILVPFSSYLKIKSYKIFYPKGKIVALIRNYAQ